jgi:ubiquinone/menaquinone biosynthesis C-methylase UbiE
MTQEARFFTDGEAYDRQMGGWSRSAGKVFLDWLSMPRGLRWLDAGCGTGAFTKLILERSDPSLLCAIDPSERQIDYARATPWAREVTIRVGTAQSVPFESAEFDVVVMALVIHPRSFGLKQRKITYCALAFCPRPKPLSTLGWCGTLSLPLARF